MSHHPSQPPVSPPTRREFLAQSAVLAAVPVGAGLAIPRSAHAAGSDRLRIGLIGCGGRGCGAAASALTVDPAAQLTAVADAFPDRTEFARNTLQKKFEDQVVVDDGHCFSGLGAYRKLLDSGSVDVALLVEPPHFRPIHVDACIEAGVHVFAEKPMGVDAPGVRRLLAAGEKAKEKKLSFVSGFETRYRPGAREVMQRVHDGAIGEIQAIQCNYNTGFLWHRGRQPDWTEMQYQLRNWYYFTWLSGDHNVEQHCHLMDMAAWILRDEPPVDAWGVGGRQVRVEAKWGDIFDHHAVVYEYASGTRVYGICRQQANCWNDVSLIAYGTKGRLTGGLGRLTLTGETNYEGAADQEHPELITFREMFAGIRAGTPVNEGTQIARSTMLSILGRMATHSGLRIRWDDALASKLDLSPERYDWDATPPILPDADGKYPVPIPGVTKVL
ncbi:MAG: Gfo/Idh/MocA family oxidoreductase [Pirellulaceae bacterium]|nr:Gfo/Idh/MocA family oxidoreductase [Pirellulaceae bacterium]